MAVIHELLEFIQSDNRQGDQASTPPATKDEIEVLQKELQRQYRASLPEEYYAFLRLMDGGWISELSIGGTRSRPVLYADGMPHLGGLETESVIDIFDGFHPDDEAGNQFVPVMRGGGCFYGWDMHLGLWREIFEWSQEAYRNYRNFPECLADALDMTSRDVQHFMPTDFAFTHHDDNNQIKHGTRPLRNPPSSA